MDRPLDEIISEREVVLSLVNPDTALCLYALCSREEAIAIVVEEVEVAELRTIIATTPERYRTPSALLPTLPPSSETLLNFDARFLHLLPPTSPSAIRSTTPAGVNDPVPKILSSNDDLKTCQEMLTQKLTSRMIVEKSLRDKRHRDVRASRNLWVKCSRLTVNRDWVHDKYEHDPHTRAPQRDSYLNGRLDRNPPELERAASDARLRVDNLHYDLTEDDLEGLFSDIAPVVSLSLRYDRAGRSTGTAYVTYGSISAANRAIREFDGANAAGQPIHLTLLPTAPASDFPRDRNGAGRAGGSRNPFDTAAKPGRSLFDRIEDPNIRRRGGRSRSRSPGLARRSNVMKPAPEGVDRYVPGERYGGRSRRRSRTESPGRRRRSPARPRRGGVSARDRDDDGHPMVGGRPRKTQEELDQEMEDYWGGKKESNGTPAVAPTTLFTEEAPSTAMAVDEDVDMIT